MADRLQKILSRYGVASRREAEQLILAGRVKLNGAIVTELGTKADPTCDRIEVDNHLIVKETPQILWVLLYKPVGFICTRHDPQGRKTIFDLLPPTYDRLYYVGRLDYNSSGALLLTNDGDRANLLTHPRHHIPKTYEVWVKGQPSQSDLQQWRQGVLLDEKTTLPADVTVLAAQPQQTQLRIVLREGRNRQIRRVAEQLGYPVLALHRVAIASITLGDLRSGSHRLLKPCEIEKLALSHSR
ncbi:pseudouridine synthase [Tumidithrix elongata RA019]|uniref:Pseudouridine synthase n=1 Tax=Tumidithrix elongata BACA0141 TaxID=2716417 RepID=A0AAW9PYB9_9CYAN|nr:pseudouridine synthase [Tumidithrix elongata RA019]